MLANDGVLVVGILLGCALLIVVIAVIYGRKYKQQTVAASRTTLPAYTPRAETQQGPVRIVTWPVPPNNVDPTSYTSPVVDSSMEVPPSSYDTYIASLVATERAEWHADLMYDLCIFSFSVL